MGTSYWERKYEDEQMMVDWEEQIVEWNTAKLEQEVQLLLQNLMRKLTDNWGLSLKERRRLLESSLNLLDDSIREIQCRVALLNRLEV